jgi:hypothetical protein
MVRSKCLRPKLARRGSDQVLALLGTRPGERAIAPRDQALAGIVLERQVALVEQMELQGPGLSEVGDGAANS